VVGGDFNFVMSKEDRLSKVTGEFSGSSDSREAEAWRHTFCPESGLYEQLQTDATHDGPVSRGRLDRVYVTHSVADQLDHLMFATALEWTTRLSHHRPLAFGKIKKQRKGDGAQQIAEQITQEPAWPSRVAAEYHEIIAQPNEGRDALDKLKYLKRAIRTVSDRVKGELVESQATIKASIDDDLGVIMGALRRLERVNWLPVKRLSNKCASLGDAISQELVERDPQAAAAVLRELAVSTARKAAQEELETLHRELPEMDPGLAKRRRCSNLQRIKKLAPGKAAAITALEDSDGAVQADPEDIARILRHHWGDALEQGHEQY